MPGAPVNVLPVLVVAFVGWRMYGRLRRNVGRQLFKRRRLNYRICIYGALTLLLAGISLLAVHPLRLMAGLFGGLIAGAPLGLYGLRLTRFETDAEGRFYTPNPYMGVGLSLLLAGRLAYRLIVLSRQATQTHARPQAMQSPLTLFLFGLLAGYYIVYFSGILARHRDSRLPSGPDSV
jgi:hypothetical protein